jgi:group I intron endonuclease
MLTGKPKWKHMVIPWETPDTPLLTKGVNMIGIYKITNKKNNKIYIGQSVNIERRLQEHKQKRNVTIDDYINVLGSENFDFEVVEECKIEDLDKKEKFYISLYDSQNNGYNIQEGGFNSSKGSNNGRALLTEEDVVTIRKAYSNHENPIDVYNSLKHTGISKSSFQAVWQGRSWSDIMPEVYTLENKNFYIKQMSKKYNSMFSKEEVIKYRKYYINHTAEETYNKIIQEKGEGFTTLGTVKKCSVGMVKKRIIIV